MLFGTIILFPMRFLQYSNKFFCIFWHICNNQLFCMFWRSRRLMYAAINARLNSRQWDNAQSIFSCMTKIIPSSFSSLPNFYIVNINYCYHITKLIFIVWNIFSILNRFYAINSAKNWCHKVLSLFSYYNAQEYIPNIGLHLSTLVFVFEFQRIFHNMCQ